MFLKPAGQPNTFDVFLGLGWDSWSRISVAADGSVVNAGGIPLDDVLRNRIKNRLSVMFYSGLRAKRKK